jgi:hypothetical protein
MSIAVDIVAAITRPLVRIGEVRETRQNQDADYYGSGLGGGGKSTHCQ